MRQQLLRAARQQHDGMQALVRQCLCRAVDRNVCLLIERCGRAHRGFPLFECTRRHAIVARGFIQKCVQPSQCAEARVIHSELEIVGPQLREHFRRRGNAENFLHELQRARDRALHGRAACNVDEASPIQGRSILPNDLRHIAKLNHLVEAVSFQMHAEMKEHVFPRHAHDVAFEQTILLGMLPHLFDRRTKFARAACALRPIALAQVPLQIDPNPFGVIHEMIAEAVLVFERIRRQLRMITRLAQQRFRALEIMRRHEQIEIADGAQADFGIDRVQEVQLFHEHYRHFCGVEHGEELVQLREQQFIPLNVALINLLEPHAHHLRHAPP